MFKKQLINDCRLIFGIKKVIFGSCLDGVEQGALYIDVSSVRENVQDGYIRFVVSCKIGTLYTRDGNPNGWLLGCLKQAAKKEDLKKAVSRFMITSREQNTRFDTYQDFFTQSEIECIYRVSIPYDPAEKTNGFIAKIKELLKR